MERASVFPEPLSPIASSSESNTSRASSQNNHQPASAEEHSKARDERLCKLFELEDEHFKDYFLCAYTAKNGWFLVQGLLYVFERHVCFFSNLFGIETAKVIPLEQVRQVCKTKHLGLPNSITVYHTDETATTFTSFLSRRAAYDLITESLQSFRSSPEPVACARPPTGRKTKVSVWGRHWERTSNVPRVGSTGKLKRTRSVENGLASRSYDQDAVWAAVVDTAGPSGRPGRAGHRRNNSHGSRGSSLVRGGGEGMQLVEAEEWEDDLSQRASDVDQGLELQGSPFAEASAQTRILAAASEQEAPPPPEGNTALADFTMEGLAPLQVAEVLLAEGAEDSVFVAFHNANGHRKAQLSEEGWQAGDRVSDQLQGWVRDFEFETKKLGKWTRCVQQQHCCAYQGGTTVIFATQQKMPDLSMFPMGKVGDQFSVETHWRLSTLPAPPARGASTPPPPPSPTRTPRSPTPTAPATHVTISGTVRFFSHASGALPRGVITSTAIAELKDWFTRLLPYIQDRARQTAAAAGPSRSPRPLLPLAAHSAPDRPKHAGVSVGASAPFPHHSHSSPLPPSPAVYPGRAAAPPPVAIPRTPSAPSPASTSLRTPLPALWPSDDPPARSAAPGAAPAAPLGAVGRSYSRLVQYRARLQRALPSSARSVSRKFANHVLRSHQGGLAGLGRLAVLVLVLALQAVLLHTVWHLHVRVRHLEARLGAA